jgi:UDP:flavonoid glycosyltransferase YjiC (YdhE family)
MLLAEFGLQKIESALKLFDWADKSFCPSIRKLEPIEKNNVYYCGALKSVSANESLSTRAKILVYMGSGTISPKKMLNVIINAFSGSKYKVYIASASLKEMTVDNIHIARRWDFEVMLDEAVLFINHGGQNSVIDGLLHGVPQIMIPGNVFERNYNANSIADNGAGVVIPVKDFNPTRIQDVSEHIIQSKEMSANAAGPGAELARAGGISVITREIRN